MASGLAFSADQKVPEVIFGSRNKQGDQGVAACEDSCNLTYLETQWSCNRLSLQPAIMECSELSGNCREVLLSCLCLPTGTSTDLSVAMIQPSG